jgi:hypothetical protein
MTTFTNEDPIVLTVHEVLQEKAFVMVEISLRDLERLLVVLEQYCVVTDHRTGDSDADTETLPAGGS